MPTASDTATPTYEPTATDESPVRRPAITAVSPDHSLQFNPAQIHVLGVSLDQADAVRLVCAAGSVALSIEQLAPEEIVVVLPAGAASVGACALELVLHDGQAVRWEGVYEVLPGQHLYFPLVYR